MKNSLTTGGLYKILITVGTFWLLDFLLHATGVGETNFYYASKFGNAVLFALIWFFVRGAGARANWKRILYSFAFSTYISFYYLIASYSGLVQFFFGIGARYTPPPFVLFGVVLPPFWWWVFHALAFYLGLLLADALCKTRTEQATR